MEKYSPLFETRSRISIFRSRASRRERDFLSSFLWFETRTRTMLKKVLLLRDGFLFLAQWIIKRFQIKESSLCLKDYLIVFLRNTLQLAARNTTSFCYGLEVPLVVFCFVLELLAPRTVVIDWYQTTLINEILSFYFSRFCLSISRLETRMRISFSKSQSSRREWEFCSLNLSAWDENEIFILLISEFETRTRFFSEHLRVRDKSEIFSFKVLRSSEKKWI